MKASLHLVALAGTLAGSLLTCHSADIRYVGSYAVDLQPAYAWQLTKTNERPLKHWRLIKIKSIDEQFGSLEKCTIETEEHTSSQLIVVNMPQPLHEAVTRYQEATKQMISLQDAQSEMRLAGTPGNWYQQRQAAGASATIAENLAKVEQEQKMATEASLKLKAEPLLAMFTGRKYAGLEIWDCGRK